MPELNETVHMVAPGVDPASGFPMHQHHDYRLPRAAAQVRYQRGHARPAAEVYLSRLRGLGVTGITVSGDAETSVHIAAKHLGLHVKGK